MRSVTSTLLVLVLCTLPLLFAAPTAPATPRPPRAELGTNAPRPTGLDEVERAALRAASARTPELGALRAGEFSLHLSDHDVRVIAITVVVVLLLFAIF